MITIRKVVHSGYQGSCTMINMPTITCHLYLTPTCLGCHGRVITKGVISICRAWPRQVKRHNHGMIQPNVWAKNFTNRRTALIGPFIVRLAMNLYSLFMIPNDNFYLNFLVRCSMYNKRDPKLIFVQKSREF
jgi:hypothetical protein